MTIVQDPTTGVWQIEIDMEGVEPVRLSSETTIEADAQELHDKLRTDIWRQLKLGAPPRATWDFAVSDFLTAGERKGKRSIDDDRDRLRWVLPKFTGLQLTAITADRIQAALNAKEEDGAAPGTINRYRAVILGVLNHARRRGWLFNVPHVDPRPESSEGGMWISRDEADSLIAELPPHLAAMARFSLSTGLRQANVTHLKWSNVDTDRRLAWVDATDAKGKRTLRVPLSSEAVLVLDEQRGKHETWVFPYANRTPDGRLARVAGPVTQPAGAAWQKAKQRAGINPAFRWHDLRHTWATWHVQGGTPLEVLQRLGGWRGPEMVARYAKFAPDHLASFADNAARGSAQRYGQSAAVIPLKHAPSRPDAR